MAWRSVARNKREVPDDPEDFRATLTEHLDELRTRIIRIVTLIVIGWVIGWYFQPHAYEFLNNVVTKQILTPRPGHKPVDYKEVFGNATDAFMLKFKLSFMLGLIVAMPFCVMQLWAFIKPGLKPNERKPVTKIAPFSVLLFFMGAAFCFIILPSAIGWFVSYLEEFPGTSLYQEPGKMVFFILKLELAFGLAFQLPLIVFLLGTLGILTPETLLQYWRQSALGIFVISMIVTPSNDPGTMLMMAIPLCFLFIVSVYLVKWTTRKRRKAEAEAAAENETEE